MSSHTVLESPDEHSSALLCSFNFQLQFGFNIPRPGASRRRRSEPPPYSKALESGAPEPAEKVIRCGPVHAQELGARGIRSWLFNVNWLVLTDGHLALHASANKAPRVMISCADIVHIDPTAFDPCSLVLQTKDKNYLLSFRNDDELYGWKDAISARMNEGISMPWNFKHHIHVTVDPVTNAYTGLPESWATLSHSIAGPHPNFSRPIPPNDIPAILERTDRRLLRIAIDCPAQPGLVSITLPV
ncbi:hypothetical protein C8R46DRAFT_277115 [Mycena filopes]|nr:hypothetical protein C8R46DRAFT_277115 [Mycena filopes]